MTRRGLHLQIYMYTDHKKEQNIKFWRSLNVA